MGVVFTKVLAQPGDLGMGFRAAEFLVGAFLANRGLDERRARQVDAGTAPHQDDVVGKAGQVGATGGGRAVHHGNLRDALRRQAGLVGETASAVYKDFALVHQVGATAFHQIDHRQLVLAGDLLGAQGLAQTHGRHGAAFDRAVACGYQATPSRHHADADDGAAAHDRLLSIVVVHVETGQAAEFQEGRAPVQQAGDAFARQQLAALFEFVAL